MHIAVIYGGLSEEREVSVSSSKGVIKGLKDLGHQVTSIDMGRDVAQILTQIKPDLVYNCLHGSYGENGCLPGLLEIMDIPYTHSGVTSSALGMNKYLSKKIFSYNNIISPEAILVDSHQIPGEEPFERPYVVKPVSEGSSVGVRIIHEGDDFSLSDLDFEKYGQFLVEKFVKGKEIHVAVFDGEAVGAVEIRPKNEFYNYESKYTEGKAEHLIPTSLSQEELRKIYEVCEKIYHIFECRGVIRIDTIFDDVTKKLYVLEFNTHPGMTELSLVPEIYQSVGISYNELLKIIVDDAILNGKKK